MNQANRCSPPRAQRGVAAIFAAVSLVTLLSAVALAIDVGRLYHADRDLQRMADLAAMDGARVHSQCLGSAGLEQVTTEVAASLKRNRMPTGVTTRTRLGLRQSGENGLQFFQPSLVDAAADSVQVTLSRTSPARILPLFAGDDSRTLSARAAAQAEWVADASISPPRGVSGGGNFGSAFLDRAFGGSSFGTGRGGGTAGASATLSVADIINANGEVTNNLPDMLTPTPVPGLLSQIASLLDQSGDSAAAAAVRAYSDAVAAARPGASVIPAEVFGLPAQGAYDGATTTVGDALNAIAGAVSQGDPIALGGLCDLIALDELPTAELLPAFCNTSVTARVPQPSNSGVFNSSTPISSTSTTSSGDSANSGGGLVEVRVGLVNPVDGLPISLPLRAVIEPANARVTALSCPRLGQAMNVASVTASGSRVTFAIGDSNRFRQSFAAPAPELAGALDDLGPAPLLTATVRQVLAAAGVSAAVLNNPLLNTALAAPITISVQAGPVVVGDRRSEDLCMQGPPFGVAEQCNGRTASVGGSSAEEAADAISSGLGDVEITIDAPTGLPLGLDSVLAAAMESLRQTLASRLKPAVQLASAQLVPVLQSANLVVGESYVYLDSAKATQPEVYAQ